MGEEAIVRPSILEAAVGTSGAAAILVVEATSSSGAPEHRGPIFYVARSVGLEPTTSQLLMLGALPTERTSVCGEGRTRTFDHPVSRLL